MTLRLTFVLVIVGLCIDFTPAKADSNAYAQAQLRLADTYFRAGNSASAIAPLLNVLRHGGPIDLELSRATRLRLAFAYTQTGLYGSARRLYTDLVKEHDPHWSGAAYAGLVRLSVREGDSEAVAQALRDYTRNVPELDSELLLEAAKVLFYQSHYQQAIEVLAYLNATASDMEHAYYRGAALIAINELDAARAAFREAHALASAKDTPALLNLTRLALGRLALRAGEADEADHWYGLVERTSSVFDRALYERAWVALHREQLAEAIGYLLQLAIEQPHSPLMARSQVFYGYLLLEAGEFLSAEQRFSAYVAQFRAVDDTIADIESRTIDLQQGFSAQLERAILSGSRADIEVVSWLRHNVRMQRLTHLHQSIEVLEAEYADTMRAVRDVQGLAELPDPTRSNSYLGGLDAVDYGQRLLRDEIRFVRRLDSVGRRLGGLALDRYGEVRLELDEIHRILAELDREARRNQDKRHDLVGVLQYIDEAQWADSTAEGEFTQTDVKRMFARLDAVDQKILLTRVRAVRAKKDAYETMLDILAGNVWNIWLRESFDEFHRLSKSSDLLLAYHETSANERALSAARHRDQVGRHLLRARELHQEIRRLTHAAQEAHAAVIMAESEAIREFFRDLLTYAKLGSVDVAWRARKSADEQLARISQSERDTLAALHAAYLAAIEDVTDVDLHDSFGARRDGLARVRGMQTQTEGAMAVIEQGTAFMQRQRRLSADVATVIAESEEQDRSGQSRRASHLLFALPKALDNAALTQVSVAINGRTIRQSDLEQGFVIAAGAHQVDVTLVYKSDDGAVKQYQSSLLQRFVPGSYRISAQQAGVGLQITVARMGEH
jgi:predicted negative regulator of RcsB-dependent stress response